MKNTIVLIFLWLVGLAAYAADPWPQRAIKIVIPYSPGGTTDLIIRTLQNRLADTFKQPIIIEYAPGASAIIGTARAADADDNHTFLATADEFVTNSVMEPDGKHDSSNFRPVALLANSPILITTQANSAFTDAKKLLSMTRLTYGNAGPRSISAMVLYRTNPNWTSVNYKGGSPMWIDLISGNIDIGATSVLQAASHIESSKAVPVMIYSRNRSPFLPNVPTSFEMGVPIEGIVWIGVVAPKSTTKAAVDKMSQALLSAMNDRVLVQPLIDKGLIADNKNPAQFDKFLADQHVFVKRSVKSDK
jgi:tripartite-type tricarboxylate transporter receptor subunit TctC